MQLLKADIVGSKAFGSVKHADSYEAKKDMTLTTTPWYVLNSPELGGAFDEFSQSCRKSGILDRRTKELLSVVLAYAFRYRCSMEEHLLNALAAGVTKEELTEALLLATLEEGGTQLDRHKDLFNKYLT